MTERQKWYGWYSYKQQCENEQYYAYKNRIDEIVYVTEVSHSGTSKPDANFHDMFCLGEVVERVEIIPTNFFRYISMKLSKFFYNVI